MTSFIGHRFCDGCTKTPGYKLYPCGHGTCGKHYPACENDIELCGYCKDEVHCVVELKAARASDPVYHKDDEWSIDKTKNLFSSLGDLEDGSNGRLHPPVRHIDNTTPTPASSRVIRNTNTEASRVAGSNITQPASSTTTQNSNPQESEFITPDNITQPQPQRYVPPALRGMQSSNTRPHPSISAATFASQPPTPAPITATTPFPSRYGAYEKPPSPFTLPGGHYRFGPEQLADNRHASLDPFIDAPRPRPRPRPQPQGFFSSASAARLAPYQSGFSGMPTQAGGNGTGTMTAPGNQLTPGNMNSFNFTAASSIQGPRHDTPMSAHQARAAHLAAIIRSGATDDPADPRYGKPGYDEEPLKPPSAPVPRGKVASTYSNALVPYDDSQSNTKGNPAAYLGLQEVPLPEWFQRASVGYLPSIEEVFAVLPMIEACRAAVPTTAGVIMINNIPYNSTRSEIVAFLGRNARIITQPEGSPFLAVHIIMDRHDAKTHQAYVEVKTPKEAVMVFNQLERRLKKSHARIGDRNVTMHVVSQAELMAALFPRAKNVEWHGNVPKVSDDREEYWPGVFSSGFQGFLQNEELHMMAKHADQPHRSPFAARMPARNYEALITVLHKYPWYAVEHVLLEERHLIFDTTLKCMRSLMELLRQNMRPGPTDRTMPTGTTLHELTVAALTCPGFSETQKAAIRLNVIDGGFKELVSSRGMNFRFGGEDSFSTKWPFHALVKKPGVDDNLVKYVANLFREATKKKDDTLTLTQLHTMATEGHKPKMFGEIHVDHTNVNSLADLGRAELRAIETTLARILRRTAGKRPAAQLA